MPANKYPWFARGFQSDGSLACGGFLVAPEYVLTAAHCVGFMTGFQVGALCDRFSLDSNCGQNVETFSIESEIGHPDYNSSSFQYDFALIKLAGSSYIDPVRIDDGSFSPTYADMNPTKGNLWAIGKSPSSCYNYVIFSIAHISVGYDDQVSEIAMVETDNLILVDSSM